MVAPSSSKGPIRRSVGALRRKLRINAMFAPMDRRRIRTVMPTLLLAIILNSLPFSRPQSKNAQPIWQILPVTWTFNQSVDAPALQYLVPFVLTAIRLETLRKQLVSIIHVEAMIPSFAHLLSTALNVPGNKTVAFHPCASALVSARESSARYVTVVLPVVKPVFRT